MKDLADVANDLESELYTANRYIEQLTEQVGQAVIDAERYKAKYLALQSAYRDLVDSVTFNSDTIHVGEEDVH